MNFIELYFNEPKPEILKPNKMGDLLKIKTCRYCGIIGDRETLRYERGMGGNNPRYDCRDAKACGQRLHNQRTTPLPDDDLPF